MNNKGVIMIAGGRGLFWKPVLFAFFSNRILTLILLHIAVSGKFSIMIASAANRTSLSNRHQTQLATHLATSSGPLREPEDGCTGLLGRVCALPGISRQYPLPQNTIQDQHQRPLHPLHSCRGRIKHEFLARRPPCEGCPFRGADGGVRQAAFWGHVVPSAL